MTELEIASEPQRRLLEYLSTAYQKGTGNSPGQERSNQLVIDAFIESLGDDIVPKIVEFLNSKKYVFDRIKEQNGARHFFNQPTVLLAYYLAEEMPAQTKENWPIDSDDLAKVFSDLGKKFD